MLTLICGHPRAGKTTFSKKYENICPVIHIDEIHSSVRVMQKVRAISGDVVVDGIYYTPRERKELLASYRGSGTRCICLDTPKEIREERMHRKIRKDYPFLVPTLDEGWDEIIIIRGNDEQRYSRQKQN